MAFIGDYRHTLDAKKRLFIPAKFRQELGLGFVVFRSLRDDCLLVYSAEEWKKYREPFEKLPRATQEQVNRYINHCAVQGDPDAQGRILLNDGLIEHAKIKKDVVVYGCTNYIEIWSAERFDEIMGGDNREALVKTLEEYGL